MTAVCGLLTSSVKTPSVKVRDVFLYLTEEFKVTILKTTLIHLDS